MTTIWKFVLTEPVTEIELPATARVLHVAAQDEMPTMWVQVPLDEPKVKRTFIGVPTGGVVEDGATYCGTSTGVDGWKVVHIYERALS